MHLADRPLISKFSLHAEPVPEVGVPAAGSADGNPNFGFDTQVAYAGFREEPTGLRVEQRKAGERDDEKVRQGERDDVEMMWRACSGPMPGSSGGIHFSLTRRSHTLHNHDHDFTAIKQRYRYTQPRFALDGGLQSTSPLVLHELADFG